MPIFLPEACIGPVCGYTTKYVTQSRMVGASPDLRLPSQPLQSTAAVPWLILISRPAEGRMLSWSQWLVTYQDGKTANHLNESACVYVLPPKCRSSFPRWTGASPQLTTYVARESTVRRAVNEGAWLGQWSLGDDRQSGRRVRRHCPVSIHCPRSVQSAAGEVNAATWPL